MVMVQGTSSSAGKSFLVAALCRSYARRGLRVAPFKAQNMSNNAAVCPDGAEIGRAQALQAYAAGILPVAEMNPILLKPEADQRSQVVVMGRPWKSIPAREYYQHHAFLWETATAALDKLRGDYDLVIIEGAGSPVELNLKRGDIVNMAVAQYRQAPVLLVGDIDRGGIFAQLLGTLWLLSPPERELVKAFVVNKLRGDISLFTEGVRILEEKGGLPVLGVAPYLDGLHIPEEDSVALELTPSRSPSPHPAYLDTAIIRLPCISNFDDFDPLALAPGVRVRYVDSLDRLGEPAAIILPGSKSTTADLSWLRSQGLADAILQFAQRGGSVVGICGGYQMLGRRIYDPESIESSDNSFPGLGLLPVETFFYPQKETFQTEARILPGVGWMSSIAGQFVKGYEIHMGRTQAPAPWLEIIRRNDWGVHLLEGASSKDGRVWGCYLHGLFANQQFCRAWLASLGWTGDEAGFQTHEDKLSSAVNRLADTVDAYLDMPRLDEIIWEN